MAVVEAVADDLRAGCTALEIMAAGASLEAAVGHPQPAIAADIERMGAVPVGMLAEAAEGGMVDADRGRGVDRRDDPALAVGEAGPGDDEVALLDPDPGAVAVLDEIADEDQAVDPGRAAAQDQGCLPFADRSVEDCGAAILGDEGDPPRFLDGAVAIAAGRDPDRARAAADRADRVGEALEAPAAFRHGERRARRRRRKGGGDCERREKSNQADVSSFPGDRARENKPQP